jgi:hypothetical protein
LAVRVALIQVCGTDCWSAYVWYPTDYFKFRAIGQDEQDVLQRVRGDDVIIIIIIIVVVVVVVVIIIIITTPGRPRAEHPCQASCPMQCTDDRAVCSSPVRATGSDPTRLVRFRCAPQVHRLLAWKDGGELRPTANTHDLPPLDPVVQEWMEQVS